MQEEFENTGDIILDLSDEMNRDAISCLSDVYDALLQNVFKLFTILGLDNEVLVHDTFLKLDEIRRNYHKKENIILENELIKKLQDSSRIKLENSDYILISDAYVTLQICCFILFDKKDITSSNLCFTIDSEREIYNVIGRIYSAIAEDISITELSSAKNIHSLGGISRANKYNQFKAEIFKEWEQGHFHTYAKCARYFSNRLDLSTKTIELWLSNKYRKC